MTEHPGDGIFRVEQAGKLETPGRIEELRPRALLEGPGGLKAGDTGVDLGSGTGVFALPMAATVGPRGQVYAVDHSPVMLDHIRAKNPPANLVLVEADVSRTALDDAIADVCLVAFVLHEVKQPELVLNEAKRLLKSGGKLLVVEWRADHVSFGPPKQRRISQRRIEKLFRESGLSSERYIDWTDNHYVATAVKPD